MALGFYSCQLRVSLTCSPAAGVGNHGLSRSATMQRRPVFCRSRRSLVATEVLSRPWCCKPHAVQGNCPVACNGATLAGWYLQGWLALCVIHCKRKGTRGMEAGQLLFKCSSARTLLPPCPLFGCIYIYYSDLVLAWCCMGSLQAGESCLICSALEFGGLPALQCWLALCVIH